MHKVTAGSGTHQTAGVASWSSLVAASNEVVRQAEQNIMGYFQNTAKVRKIEGRGNTDHDYPEVEMKVMDGVGPPPTPALFHSE